MKNILLLLLIASFTIGCASDAEIAAQTAKYTSETAQAIAAAGWKIAGAIFGGLLFHGMLTS